MKCEASINGGWLNITVSAETPQEASKLVTHGLNQSADARKVCQVVAGNDTIKAYVTVKNRRDREPHNLRSEIKPNDK